MRLLNLLDIINLSMNRLENKTAIITGGTGAIGMATARLFLQEGAQVLLVDFHTEILERKIDELNHRNVSYAAADVSKIMDVAAYAIKAQERYGKVDIFFNNATIEGEVKPITEYTERVFDQVMAVNVKGAWLGLKCVMPLMEDSGGGSIILTSSVSGLQGAPNIAAYSASKHAVIGLMRTAALEGAARNIRVNTIHPAPMDNRMVSANDNGYGPGASAVAKSEFEQSIPLQRYGTPDEVAQLVLFLASDESKYITGSTYSIDGGMSA